MATVLRAWKVEGERLVEIPELPPSEQNVVENMLEDWLASQPDAIQDNLLIIGRQVTTATGPLDLLGVNVDGKPIVVELKRDRAPRLTVAQAIDYGTWIAGQTSEYLAGVATNYLGRPVEEAFQERFGEQFPGFQLESPGILVVASRLDESTERMILYLSKHGLDIDGLVFRYIRLTNGDRILTRISVVSEEDTSDRGPQPSAETLLAMARDRNVNSQLTPLRRLGEFLVERPRKTYGGSFRYWGHGRMLCGVNVATFWGAPPAAIDVWVSHGHWAQVTGFPEDTLMQELRSTFQFVRQYEGAHQMILRIRTGEEAERFVDLLRRWFVGERSDGSRNGSQSPAAEPDSEETLAQ